MYGLRPLVASPTGPFRAPAMHTHTADATGVTGDSSGVADPGLSPVVALDDDDLIAACVEGG